MASIFLGSNNLPNYTCLSTDINGSNNVVGASRIGNTVLATDTGN